MATALSMPPRTPKAVRRDLLFPEDCVHINRALGPQSLHAKILLPPPPLDRTVELQLPIARGDERDLWRLVACLVVYDDELLGGALNDVDKLRLCEGGAKWKQTQYLRRELALERYFMGLATVMIALQVTRDSFKRFDCWVNCNNFKDCPYTDSRFDEAVYQNQLPLPKWPHSFPIPDRSIYTGAPLKWVRFFAPDVALAFQPMTNAAWETALAAYFATEPPEMVDPYTSVRRTDRSHNGFRTTFPLIAHVDSMPELEVLPSVDLTLERKCQARETRHTCVADPVHPSGLPPFFRQISKGLRDVLWQAEAAFDKTGTKCFQEILPLLVQCDAMVSRGFDDTLYPQPKQPRCYIYNVLSPLAKRGGAAAQVKEVNEERGNEERGNEERGNEERGNEEDNEERGNEDNEEEGKDNEGDESCCACSSDEEEEEEEEEKKEVGGRTSRKVAREGVEQEEPVSRDLIAFLTEVERGKSQRKREQAENVLVRFEVVDEEDDEDEMQVKEVVRGPNEALVLGLGSWGEQGASLSSSSMNFFPDEQELCDKADRAAAVEAERLAAAAADPSTWRSQSSPFLTLSSLLKGGGGGRGQLAPSPEAYTPPPPRLSMGRGQLAARLEDCTLRPPPQKAEAYIPAPREETEAMKTAKTTATIASIAQNNKPVSKAMRDFFGAITDLVWNMSDDENKCSSSSSSVD